MGCENANEVYQAQCFDKDCLKVKPAPIFSNPVGTCDGNAGAYLMPELRQCSAVAHVLSACTINSLSLKTGQTYDKPKFKVVLSPLFKISCVQSKFIRQFRLILRLSMTRVRIVFFPLSNASKDSPVLTLCPRNERPTFKSGSSNN